MTEATCRVCGITFDTSRTTFAEQVRQSCCSVACMDEHFASRPKTAYARRRLAAANACPSECCWCHQVLPLVKANRYCSDRCCEQAKMHRITYSAKNRDQCPLVILDCLECGQPFVTRHKKKCCPQHDDPAQRQRRKQRAAAARYRARKRSAVTETFRHEEIFDRDGWKCGLCGESIDPLLVYPHPRSVSLDHIVPLSQGGDHSRANCQASHLDCNCRKSDGVVMPEQLRLVG